MCRVDSGKGDIMKLLFENWRQFISEEILPFENKAIVYHAFGRGSRGNESLQKDQILNRIETLREKGFIPGEGDLYGRGIYTVRNSNDLLSEYGDFVLKFEVQNLNKYAIFDYKEAKKVYGRNHDLKQQLEQNDLSIDEDLEEICNQTDLLNRRDEPFTSEQALKFSTYLENNASEKQKIHGLVFTGRKDGSVLVGYKISDFILVGFGETLSVKSTNFNNFLQDQQKFIEDMKSIYTIQNDKIKSDSFFRQIRSEFYTKIKSVENYTNNKENIKREIISGILMSPIYIVEEEYHKQRMRESLAPKVFEYYKKLIDVDSDEDIEENEDYDIAIYEAEEALSQEIKSIVENEITRFVTYLDFIFRKFKLTDEPAEINIIDLERPFNMSGEQNV